LGEGGVWSCMECSVFSHRPRNLRNVGKRERSLRPGAQELTKFLELSFSLDRFSNSKNNFHLQYSQALQIGSEEHSVPLLEFSPGFTTRRKSG
jgi:hypothetical protein